MKRTPLERRTPLRAKRRNYGGVRRALESKPHGDPKLAALGARTVNFPSEAEMILASKKRRDRKKTKHARRERAPESWWVFVKTRQCFVQVLLAMSDAPEIVPFMRASLTPCSGGIDADHMGSKTLDGDGEMAPDRTCAGICHGHHMERHDFAGTFRSFAKDDMRDFLRRGIAWTYDQARALGVDIPDC